MKTDTKLLMLIAVFGLIGLAPVLITQDSLLNIVIMTLYAALLGQAWNILGGYGGQVSFGHAAYFGTGAYTVAVLQVQFGINPWIGLAVGGLAAAAVGAFIGFCTFRYGLRGSYFALVTLAFAEVLRILSNSVDFTGAGVGLLIPLERSAANFQFVSKAGFFWVIWAMTFAAFLTVWKIGNSRFGAQLMAVRDNEDAARALGVDAFRVKMGAIMLSGFFAGLAGVFYAQYFLYLDPHIAYGAAISVESLLVPIIGGMGTLFGPLLGAAFLHGLSELSRAVIGDAPGISLVLYGVLLVIMVLFVPRGLAGLASHLRSGKPARSRTEGAAAMLEISGLCKSFGGLQASQSVTLTVPQGGITSLIGPNGAGKTTLFALITGFHRPDSGSVRFLGEDITGLPPEAIAKRGMIRTFQTVQPFAGQTVRENIAVGAHLKIRGRAEALAKAEAVARQVGLGDRLDMDAGSLTVAGRKRLEVARALATDPKLILFDEVLAGLNPSEIRDVIPVINAIRDAGVTILLIEHVMQAVMSLSDYTWVLNQGAIIAEGPPKDVVSDPHVIEAYLGKGMAERIARREAASA